MRKLVLITCTLLLSASAIAATATTQELGSSVKNAMQKHASTNPVKTSFPLIYGGRDISRSLLATANESVWTGQEAVIG